MAQSRQQRTARRRSRLLIGSRKSTADSPADATASLPLPDAGQPLPTPVPPHARLGENSVIGDKGVQIYLMRAAGIADEQIAAGLGLSPKTLSGYVYKASKNGLLDDALQSHKDRLEHVILHKVMRNLEEGLDDSCRNENTGMQVKTAVALKVAEGALFPSVQGVGAGGGPTMMMGIKIQVVNGEPQQIREGTIVEAPAYVEGEVE